VAIYGYIRVSTTRQAEDGESLGAQERTLSGYVLMHGLHLDHVFIERGVSGSKPLEERPEGAKLLAALKAGDVVITPKLDRLFRSALDALDTLAKLKEQGVALHMIDLGGDVTGNGISKLVFTILSAVAEAERDRIRERIADVKKDQRQRGRYLGGTLPFGYRVTDEGELLEVPEHLEAIQRMKAMRAGGLSLRGVAQAMKQDGINVSHEAVREIVKRQTSH
jgi:putative DNA-invertase from lambdoid prophage Rac